MTYQLNSPFSTAIAFACIGAADGKLSSLSAQELACLSPNASQKRREQFALGRKAAREAMFRLGIASPGSVLRNPNRQPIWPQGLVGSISHTDTVAVAAVTYSSRFESLGVDLHSLSDPRLMGNCENLLAKICHESEASWIKSEPHFQIQRTALVFSAKESIFKALFPLYRSSIAFRDVELFWQDSGFEATLLFDASKNLKRLSLIRVECQTNDAYVLTGVTIETS